ncbi:helix-turn-helix domain-containing protein [Lactiplantibacillus plantarum]|nr:helix-turn-helix domain-containing protein [Lactiplantibacillus plantarum]
MLLVKKYDIKGSATIYQWLTQVEILGIQGLEHCRRNTFYDYSFKIKVIKWRQ